MKKLILLLTCLFFFKVYAQDPQFSQYYSAPLLLNPAMAGETDCYRVGMNARSQWTGLPSGAFNTASLFVDLNYPDLRSGFGLLALHDEIGTPHLSSNEISGFYSYLAPVSKMINFRFGLQGTYVSKSIDYSRLIFEDQFTGITVTQNSTADLVSNYRRINFADFSAGVILFGEESYWLGFSAHHLTQPNQGFYYSSPLPRKYSLHGGFKFFLKKQSKTAKDLTLTPSFMYKAQGHFDQLDLGAYLIKVPVLFGVWYRGIPVKKDQNIYNKDAIDLQIGYQYRGVAMTYSYDFTISRLELKNTMGSHELSIVYVFCAAWPKKKKPSRNIRRLPCPDFQRSLKYDGNF